MSNTTGKLYVVATPIGNLEDLGARAARILAEVDIIAAEDTRHSSVLLRHIGVTTPLRAYHDFSEQRVRRELLELLHSGQSVALISDAGTPLISDPGYRLVRAAYDNGIQVIPVPGPSALVCALSAAGLPTDRFGFEGYVPEKPAARRKYLETLCTESRTLVFYEAPHRILAFLRDAVAVFGASREAVLARELTKRFETFKRAPLGELLEWVTTDSNQQKGELVVILRGAMEEPAGPAEHERVLSILLEELPLKQAVTLGARLTGAKKNELYTLALEMTGNRK